MDIKPHLVIIDAHAMAYRAYYALHGKGLADPVSGMPTQAIYGFFRMFFHVLLEFKPPYCAVIWDPPKPSFRAKIYTDYKATRKAMPDDLRPQIEEIQAILKENNFYSMSLDDYEADDIMGALTKRFSKDKQVFLISGDKDCYQLLNKNVLMLRSAKGVSEFIFIDQKWLKEYLGLKPSQVTDYMALVGDASDNIPGVKGVGAKMASKLIEEYVSLESIYEQIDGITPLGLQKKLIENKKNALLSKELATIKTDLAAITNLKEEQLRTPGLHDKKLADYFTKKSFPQIARSLKKIKPSDSKTIKTNLSEKKGYTLITSLVELQVALKEIAKFIQKSKTIALDTETNSINAMEAVLVGVSLSVKETEAIYIPIATTPSLISQSSLPWEEVRPHLQSFFEDKKLRIIGQNIKYDYKVLAKWGLDLADPYFDTMIASYLCDPNSRRHGLDAMAYDLLGYDCISYEDIVGKGAKQKTMDEIPPEAVYEYACEDADITFRLYKILEKKLSKAKLEKVFYNIEMPLIPVLIRMETEGVGLDKNYFAELSKTHLKILAKLEKDIYELAGYAFNINSTKELQKLLFENLGLPTGKKTKTGFSTDQNVLENLRDQNPIVEKLLEHRKYTKLHSTYVDALPRLVNPKTLRLHTNFSQNIAATGRLSSVNPNLQNIPIREDTGRAIRKGFIPRKANVLLSMDYSQVELRIMAHYAEDKLLIEELTNKDGDIHRRTAASLFNVGEDEVTADMRSDAKVLNFSIIYGVTEFGLARNLGVDRQVASQYIEKFFEKYPGIRKYMDEMISFAEKNGYVKTLTGRIREIPSIKDKNHFRKEGAHRIAINTPIQGTSADIIKIAMIEIDNKILEMKLKSRMILQVHDELLFDVLLEEEKQLTKIAADAMQGAMSLSVPLLVESASGKNWDDAH